MLRYRIACEKSMPPPNGKRARSGFAFLGWKDDAAFDGQVLIGKGFEDISGVMALLPGSNSHARQAWRSLGPGRANSVRRRDGPRRRRAMPGES